MPKNALSEKCIVGFGIWRVVYSSKTTKSLAGSKKSCLKAFLFIRFYLHTNVALWQLCREIIS